MKKLDNIPQIFPTRRAQELAHDLQYHDDAWTYKVEPLSNDDTRARVAIFDEEKILIGYWGE